MARASSAGAGGAVGARANGSAGAGVRPNGVNTRMRAWE
jgi:hypothetical protein